MTHLETVLQEMQLAIDKARIRDAGRIRAHKLALASALIAPTVMSDDSISEDHKANVRSIISECRALAVGGATGTNPEMLLDGIPWEEVLKVVRDEVEREIANAS